MSDGRVKLADLGFCKQFSSKTGTTRTLCGTAEYIAPEVYQDTPYGFAVDLWSLGVMIYEMVALKTPFYHAHEKEVMNHVVSGNVEFSVKFSPDLRTLIAGLLQKNPQERFALDDVRTSAYYSSPYSIEDIERRVLPCPWTKRVSVLFVSCRRSFPSRSSRSRSTRWWKVVSPANRLTCHTSTSNPPAPR